MSVLACTSLDLHRFRLIARVILKNSTHITSDTPRYSDQKLLGAIDANNKMNKSPGSAMIQSQIKPKNLSKMPPKIPASKPNNNPKMSAIPTEPTISEKDRAMAAASRAIISRPRWSVPKGCSLLGADKMTSKFCSAMSWGRNSGLA